MPARAAGTPGRGPVGGPRRGPPGRGPVLQAALRPQLSVATCRRGGQRAFPGRPTRCWWRPRPWSSSPTRRPRWSTAATSTTSSTCSGCGPGELVVASDGAGRWVPCRVAADRPGRRVAPGRPCRDCWSPTGRRSRTHRLRPRAHRCLRPDQGRPPGVGDPEADRARGRPHRARCEPHARWCAGRASAGAKAVERLRRVAREAAAQCRRVRLPEVTDVCRLDEVAGRRRRPGGPDRRRRRGAPGLDRPVLAVGPEGGWDDAERDAFGPAVGLGADRAAGRDGGRGGRRAAVRTPELAWYCPLRNHAP